MKKSGKSLSLWPKLILGLLLLLFLLGGALVLFCNFQYSAAQARGGLPSLNGVRYLDVADGRFGKKYVAGSMLLVQPQAAYAPGDEVVALAQGGSDPQILLHGRYLLLKLQSVDQLRATGLPIGMSDQPPVVVPTPKIVGRVTYIIPRLGALYRLTLSAPGVLWLTLLPLALSLAWGIGMLAVSSRRRAAQTKKAAPAHARAFGKAGLPADRFDLFAQDSEPPPAPLGRPTQNEKPPLWAAAAKPEAPVNPAVSEPDDPLVRRGALHVVVRASGELDASPAPAAASAPAPSTSGTPLPPPEEEAVAIYSGKDEAAGLEPDYLHQELSGSLAELKASLRAERSTAQVVDVVVGDHPVGLDEDKLRRLRKINAFDPDKAIEEIKRKSALFTQSFLADQPELLRPESAPPKPIAPKPAPPEPIQLEPILSKPGASAPEPPLSRPTEEFYQIQPGRRAEDSPPLPRWDSPRPAPNQAKRRPLCPIISVLGEEPDDLPAPERFHNRNGGK